MKSRRGFAIPLCGAMLLLLSASALPQSTPTPSPLDLARDPAALTEPHHAPLAEQYIWTAGEVTALLPASTKFATQKQRLRIAPRYFRKTFTLASVPSGATLYVAGPRSARVWINGALVASFTRDIDQPLGMHVFAVEVAGVLRAGSNTIAIEAVRGRPTSNGESNALMSQLAYGEVLVAKILPAKSRSSEPDPAASPLLISDTSWKSSAEAEQGWQQPGFHDSSWRKVESLGPIEGNPDFFQWNADAGLYDWPGYLGMSPSLRTYPAPAADATHLYAAGGHFDHLDDLRSSASGAGFSVTLPASGIDPSDPPHLLLDFGREIAGRLYVESACRCTEEISVSYGESEGEALSGQQFLGVNALRIGPGRIARGPKSAFRYAYIRFLGSAPAAASPASRYGAGILRFRALRAEGIAYPVEYRGSFESSDPVLNRIWEIAAYTAHLCMQDNIWDAPKRDRGRWAGDLKIEGNVISDVFGDRAAIEDTLAHLAANTNGGSRDVNGIPGYTAAWVEALAGLYRHTGDMDFLKRQSTSLNRFLERMERSLNADGRFATSDKSWFFVDWSPGLSGGTAESQYGTSMEYLSAFRAAVPLLRAVGNTPAAAHYQQFAAGLAQALHRQAVSGSSVNFGTRWQINALAILSGAALPDDDAAIWSRVLSNVKQDTWSDQVISPYFNFFLLQAMAQTGHREAALEWMRQYWGGMLAEGATSFWEAYDLRWPKNHPHLSLQADGTSGYSVSLAHGWSSGPAAWLEEQVLGIQPTAPGFRTVEIRPDLAGLAWARGAMPTPQGEIRVDLKQQNGGMSIALDLPLGETAHVSVPIQAESSIVIVNGRVQSTGRSTERLRRNLVLDHPGHYVIASR